MKPAHLVIYAHGGGRLGNQVIRFLHWIAWVRANEPTVGVLNVAFWPFAKYFARWHEQPACSYPSARPRIDAWARRYERASPRIRNLLESRTRLGRLVQLAGRWAPRTQAIELDIAREEQLDLEDPQFLGRVKRRRVTVCSGWRIAAWSLVAAQQSSLRELFRPAVVWQRAAEDFVRSIRERRDILIGVFIRQSDYREWYEGRFLYAPERYAAWMREIEHLYRGRRVGFIIASEVMLDPEPFAGLPVYFATGSMNVGGHWFASWVELSLCDVIMSPPSTFSATAAFLGDVPLWPLKAADQTLGFDQIFSDGLVGAARDPVYSLSVK